MEKNKTKNTINIKRDFLSFYIAPRRHFGFVIAISFFIFVLVAGFSGYIFYGVRFFDTQKSPYQTVAPIPLINESKLESVLKQYDQKTKTQSAALSLGSSVVDPSK